MGADYWSRPSAMPAKLVKGDKAPAKPRESKTKAQNKSEPPPETGAAPKKADGK